MSLNCIFNIACNKGYLFIAKMLLHIDNHIDINNNNEHPFKIACRNGHLHIIKWLIDKNPNTNIEIDDNIGFIEACQYNNIEVINWFLEKDNIKYYVEIENNLVKNYKITKCNNKCNKYNHNINEITICPICDDNISNIITNCNHQFCDKCILLWIYTKKIDKISLCPYCRSEIKCCYNIDTKTILVDYDIKCK